MGLLIFDLQDSRNPRPYIVGLHMQGTGLMRLGAELNKAYYYPKQARGPGDRPLDAILRDCEREIHAFEWRNLVQAAKLDPSSPQAKVVDQNVTLMQDAPASVDLNLISALEN